MCSERDNADTIYKAAKIAKEYEKKGGDYENEAGSKNKPKKGEPEHKSDADKKADEKEADGEGKSKAAFRPMSRI